MGSRAANADGGLPPAQVPTDNKPMVMRSNSSALELCFWDLATRKELPPGQQRDKAWSSSSCHLSWTTQGLVPPGGNWASITSVDRSRDLQLLAAGSWGGDISLGRCPALPGSQRVHGGVGHGGGPVGGVRFSCSGHYVWSVGGRDMALLQWRVQAPASSSLAKELITLAHVPIRRKPLNRLDPRFSLPLSRPFAPPCLPVSVIETRLPVFWFLPVSDRN